MLYTAHHDRISDPARRGRRRRPVPPVCITDAWECAAHDCGGGGAVSCADAVLDVACGGGIVVCAFAPHVKRATGIDMTPAMLDRARQHAAEKGADNVGWDRGDVTALPYQDGTFNIVVTRFSMHHFLDPLGVLREMVRVCAPGGRVVVVDMYASDDPTKAAEWNRAEKLR